MDVRRIAKKVAKRIQDTNYAAKQTLCVFIAGNYADAGSLLALEKLRDKLLRFGVMALLMKDLDIKADDYRHKFAAISNVMRGYTNPKFILYAAPSSAKSQGFLAELVEIALDQEKIDRAYLFKNADLPHHHKSFINQWNVDSHDDFVSLAFGVIERSVTNIAMAIEAKI